MTVNHIQPEKELSAPEDAHQDYFRESREKSMRAAPKTGSKRVFVFAVFLIIAGVSYKLLSDDGLFGFRQVAELPVFKADGEEFKTRPTDPGGLEIEHQDKAIFSKLRPENQKDVEEVIVDFNEAPALQKEEVDQASAPMVKGEDHDDLEPGATSGALVSTSPNSVDPNSVAGAAAGTAGVDGAPASAQNAPPQNTAPFVPGASVKPKEEVVFDKKTQNTPTVQKDAAVQQLPREVKYNSKGEVLGVVDPNKPEMKSPGQEPAQDVAMSSPANDNRKKDVVEQRVADSAPMKLTKPSIAMPEKQVSEKQVAATKSLPVEMEEVANTTPEVNTQAKVEPKVQPSAQPNAQPKAKAALAKGNYALQLGAVKSRESVDQEWSRLKSKNQELTQLKLSVSEVEIPNKGLFYRIQAGQLTQADAKNLCGQLKSKNVPCLVVKAN